MGLHTSNVLCRHEASKNLIGVVPAEVQKCVALPGDAYLLNHSSDADILSDVVLGLFWQNRGCLAISCGQQNDRNEQLLHWAYSTTSGSKKASQDRPLQRLAVG